MFGIGMPEMLMILVVALIVIGPKKLPDLAKSLGRAMGEFRKATSELKESIDIDEDFGDLKKPFEDVYYPPETTVDKAPEIKPVTDSGSVENSDQAQDSETTISEPSEKSEPESSEHIPSEPSEKSEASDENAKKE